MDVAALALVLGMELAGRLPKLKGVLGCMGCEQEIKQQKRSEWNSQRV